MDIDMHYFCLSSLKKDEVLLLLEQVNNNEFQCQTGELIGRVHSSHLKIITPLDSYSSPIYVSESIRQIFST